MNGEEEKFDSNTSHLKIQGLYLRGDGTITAKMGFVT